MRTLAVHTDSRVLTGIGNAEDAAIVQFPPGQALVQTLDFFTPIVNNPFWFGQIAAANSLSDIYAMGARPYVVMNIVCFPVKTMELGVLREVLRGGLLKIHEAGAMLVGGHSVQDEELKYGLSVSGIVDPNHYASNTGLRPGDVLLLTKPIGSGVLATAVKAEWEGADRYEQEVFQWASRLNRVAGEAIAHFGLRGATDITGFGLGGHLLEMACASDCSLRVRASAVPLMHGAYELASMGLVPEGSFANKRFCHHAVHVDSGCDPVRYDLLFDAQTSGGLVLAIPATQVSEVQSWMESRGEQAVFVGEVCPPRADGVRLHIC
ncbi:selenide, water dikinase [Desulfovibrionales bacterium]